MPHVIVIEDDPEVRDMITWTLELEGFEVTATEDGLAGLEAARQDPPDVIVLDIMMPELNGWEVAELLREDSLLRNVPFLFCSAVSEPANVWRGWQAGAASYITKPFDGTVFVNEVRRAISDSAHGAGDAPATDEAMTEEPEDRLGVGPAGLVLVPQDPPPAARRATDIAPGRPTSKRALIALSRRIEALAEGWAATEEPVVLIGLFQLAEYYEQSREVYRRLAAIPGAQVVAAFEDTEGLRDDDVHLAEIDPDSPLADHWTVLLLTPRACAGLRAVDVAELGRGVSVEGARVFTANMTTEPDETASWLHELVESDGFTMDDDVRELLLDAAAGAGAKADPGDSIAAGALARAWEQLTNRIESLQASELRTLTDPLTGAFNVHFLDRFLAQLGGRAPQIALAALDLDDFQGFNDEHGRALGDEALRLVASVVENHVRDSDALVRLGGDTWLLIMPGATAPVALARVEGILEDLEGRPLSASGARLRASAGIGAFDAADVDLDEVRAALRRAKQSDQRTMLVTE